MQRRLLASGALGPVGSGLATSTWTTLSQSLSDCIARVVKTESSSLERSPHGEDLTNPQWNCRISANVDSRESSRPRSGRPRAPGRRWCSPAAGRPARPASWSRPSATHRYVSLDVPMVAEEAEHSGEDFLRRHQPPVIIDEVQYAPTLLRHVKADIDLHREETGRFLITGSQDFSLMEGVTESLAGRSRGADPPLAVRQGVRGMVREDPRQVGPRRVDAARGATPSCTVGALTPSGSSATTWRPIWNAMSARFSASAACATSTAS